MGTIHKQLQCSPPLSTSFSPGRWSTCDLHQLHQNNYPRATAFQTPHRPSSVILELRPPIHITTTITMSAEADQQVKLVSSDNVEIVTERKIAERSIEDWDQKFMQVDQE